MGAGRHWTLLTNHGACLLLIASRADMTVSEVAGMLRVTERSATRILADLRTDGYLIVRREGRRNRYSVNLDAPLRHPIGENFSAGDLLGGILARAGPPGIESAPTDVGDVTAEDAVE